MGRLYHILKSYLLYILWASFKRHTGLTRQVRLTTVIFCAWLTRLFVEGEEVLVVEQPTLTTLVVIPYSFWHVIMAREK